MRFSNKSSPQSTRHAAFLYAVVFNSAFSMCIILLLFISFFIQPIHQAYAETTEETPEATSSEQPDVTEEAPPEASGASVSEVSTEEVEVESGDEVSETTQVNDDTNLLSGTTTAAPVTNLPASSNTESVIESEPTQSSTSAATVSSSGVDDSTDSDAVLTASSTATTSDESLSNSVEGGTPENDPPTSVTSDGVPTSVDDVAPQSTSASSANPSQSDDSTRSVADASTSDVDNDIEPQDEGPIHQVEQVITDQNFYQFSRQSCVAVGAGAYHCTDRDDGIDLDGSTTVFSESGPNGNLEIFLRTSRGEVRQVTENGYDDSAPYYDPQSLKVVWQRLIDGRYQIIMYDIEKNTETQLTFTRTNNMEPKMYKSDVVWQAWDGEDWEIMHFDGTYTTQITDNSLQDVAPAVQDRYVMWSVLGRDTQEARVHSLDSGETLTVTGHEGGRIQNPRFVLVYDTEFDNGDIVTQGFDPETGLARPIAAQPRPEPIDIPDADTTGEIRALIQNKSYTKESGEVKQQTPTSGSAGTASSSTVVATSSLDAPTLDLTQPTDAGEIGSTTVPVDIADEPIHESAEVEESFELTEYDLIITPEMSEEALFESETPTTSATSSDTTTP